LKLDHTDSAPALHPRRVLQAGCAGACSSPTSTPPSSWGHPGHIVRGALRSHELKSAHLRCCAAKCAEAFSKNAMSFAFSATCARSRTSSARSSAESGSPPPGSGTPPLPAAAIRSRSSATHVCSSRADPTHGQPRQHADSRRSPRRAASTLYSGVNERRGPSIRTSFKGP
jgi:hypothetical protein